MNELELIVEKALALGVPDWFIAQHLEKAYRAARASGTRECGCGRIISANKRSCLNCSE
jgi:hypothetical protein